MAGRSDVEALSRSFRSRIVLLVLLLCVGIAAAVWTSLAETGIGAPEDRRRIMIVSADAGRDQEDVDYFAVFEQAGFEVEIETMPTRDAEGMALLLEQADREGVALVVFESPIEHDFTDLTLDPPIESIERLDERQYVALSVGDYAAPHRLTVDDPGDDPIVRLPGYGALQAVFRQELISFREVPERPTVAELQFEDSIRVGREMFERPAKFAAWIAAARVSVEAKLDDHSGARTLVPTLSTGTAIATPDGGILLFSHELVIHSANARTLELEAADHMQLSWISSAALSKGIETGEFEREPCTSLADGALALAEQPSFEAAVDGSAVAIESAEGGAVVWRKTEAPGCEWDVIAELDRIEGVVLAPRFAGSGEPSRSVAARVENGERSQVLVWTRSDDQVEPQRVIQQSGREFGGLAFLDDRHLALTSSTIVDADANTKQAAEDRVYLLDRERPDLYLSIPVEFFAEHRRLHGVVALAPASGASGPELLVTARNPQGRIELIRVRVGAQAWDAFLLEQPKEAELGVEGTMVSLTPAQLEAEILAETQELLGLDVRPGALIFGSADGPRSGELTLVDLASGDRRALTENWIRDYAPRFVGDGRYAVFVSLMQVNFSLRPFSVPRMLALDGKK